MKKNKKEKIVDYSAVIATLTAMKKLLAKRKT